MGGLVLFLFFAVVLCQQSSVGYMQEHRADERSAAGCDLPVSRDISLTLYSIGSSLANYEHQFQPCEILVGGRLCFSNGGVRRGKCPPVDEEDAEGEFELGNLANFF